jgi:hypothetical protein
MLLDTLVDPLTPRVLFGGTVASPLPPPPRVSHLHLSPPTITLFSDCVSQFYSLSPAPSL